MKGSGLRVHRCLVCSSHRRTVVSKQDNLFNRCAHASILGLSSLSAKPGCATASEINRKYVPLFQTVK